MRFLIIEFACMHFLIIYIMLNGIWRKKTRPVSRAGKNALLRGVGTSGLSYWCRFASVLTNLLKRNR